MPLSTRSLGRLAPIVRPLLAVAVVALIALFAHHNRKDFAGVPGVLKRAHPAWLLAVAACEVVAMALIVERVRWLLERLGHRAGRGLLLRACLRRKAISAVVPAGGAPATLLFVRDLGRAACPPATPSTSPR